MCARSHQRAADEGATLEAEKRRIESVWRAVQAGDTWHQRFPHGNRHLNASGHTRHGEGINEGRGVRTLMWLKASHTVVPLFYCIYQSDELHVGARWRCVCVFMCIIRDTGDGEKVIPGVWSHGFDRFLLASEIDRPGRRAHKLSLRLHSYRCFFFRWEALCIVVHHV